MTDMEKGVLVSNKDDNISVNGFFSQQPDFAAMMKAL